MYGLNDHLQMQQQKEMQNLAILLTKKWGKLVETSKEELVDFYHKNAILVPTFSDTFAVGHEQINQYFVKLTNENPNLSVEFIEIIPQIGDSWIMSNGVYIFHGKESTLARFTFFFGYCPHHQDWKVITHHSSVMPPK